MKFKCLKNDIVNIVQYANSFTTSKNISTILQNLYIEAEGNEITIKSTNLQTAFTGRFEAEIEQTGTTTIPAKKFAEILKELPDGSIIDAEFTGSKFIIKSGKSKFTLSTLPPEHFPTISDITPEYFIRLKSEELKKMLEKIQFCISNDHSKLEYTGGHFKVFGNKLELSAADFQKIGITESTFEEEFSDEFTINIPKKTITELIKLLDLDEFVSIETDRKQAIFNIGNITIFTKLIEKYISSLNKLFNIEYKVSVRLPKERILDSVKRVSTLTSDITHAAVFSFNHNQLDIYSLETEYGQGYESVDGIEYENEPMDIILNTKHVIDVLNHIDTEYFIIKLVGRKNPVLIFPDEDWYRYLLTPISIERKL
ncbi:DNA polymerase III subunit beta [Deferribacter autotrophicus]|uniref:Beta sliding clamp n=1 Tax=Deferribacter autotrophicus TaxID=500465 RepID=A0A5A8F618_9BACT|nr:DNA polymerase III subunit beta [Deferribacter autotrophicus]KAA0258853.1 DNA polymerase III subunit beta [Deferribacter autotrophicus]